MIKNLKENYSPMYFLSALGNGGLSISFFMYLMFMVKHPETPIPIFGDLAKTMTGDSLALKVMIVAATIGFFYFAVQHFRLLFWNIKEYKTFKQTDAYNKLWNSNGAVTFMAIPLTFAMSINVVFIFGGVYVPGLWSIVEYLFPFAIAGFATVAFFAMRIFIRVMTQFFTNNVFDSSKNNSFVQMLSAFTFIMVAVGFAASAAMSKVIATSVIATILSLTFLMLALLVMGVMFTIGLKTIFEHGFDRNASPTIWLAIPILTLAGITVLRLYSGISHNLLNSTPSPYIMFAMFAAIVGIQVVFGVIGYFIMKQNSYFTDILNGKAKQPGLYSLICPGVAFVVLAMFFVGWGLVKTAIVTQFSLVYFIILIPIVLVQLKTVTTLHGINKKMLFN